MGIPVDQVAATPRRRDGACGQLETDRYIVPKSERPMGNLFLSMLGATGTPAEGPSVTAAGG